MMQLRLKALETIMRQETSKRLILIEDTVDKILLSY